MTKRTRRIKKIAKLAALFYNLHHAFPPGMVSMIECYDIKDSLQFCFEIGWYSPEALRFLLHEPEHGYDEGGPCDNHPAMIHPGGMFQ